MKYLFGIAVLLLLYAVVGVLSQPTDHAGLAKPVQSVAATPPASQTPTFFKVIRVVDDRAASPAPPPAVAGDQDKIASLTVEIQQRLTDANCFAGTIDGTWSNGTRDAARRFIVGARAELPSDHPDDGLLALLRSRGDDKSLCSVSDPSAQAATSDDSVRNAAAMAELGPPMGLGGPSSNGYYSSRGEDHSFRHPLGGF